MFKKIAPLVIASAALAIPSAALAADGQSGGPKANASGLSVERVLAGQKCREKAFEDRAEFRFDYGSGSGAMARCIRRELREAHFDCRQEAREDALDFRDDYGTGATAHGRCVRDELS